MAPQLVLEAWAGLHHAFHGIRGRAQDGRINWSVVGFACDDQQMEDLRMPGALMFVSKVFAKGLSVVLLTKEQISH